MIQYDAGANLRNLRPDPCAPGAATEGMTMDEFARLMSMEGVRPLDQPKEKSRSLTGEPGPASSKGIGAPPELAHSGHAWVRGTHARTALETAL